MTLAERNVALQCTVPWHFEHKQLQWQRHDMGASLYIAGFIYNLSYTVYE